MRKIPNFVLLRAFEAAARLQSFALAARELHLTPSAISHQVKDLEAYFGRPLFIRRNRRIDPTPEALRLLDSLSRVFDVIESACTEVSLAPQAQVLAVYSAPSFAVKWLGPRLADFARHHPNITLRLSTGPEPLDLTRAQEIDVAISYGGALERPGVETVALGVEPLVPMCSPALLASAGSVEALMQEATLIDSPLSRVTWCDWFAANGLPLTDRPRPSFDRAALAISAAADGMGVVLESTRLAERELARGDLVEVGADRFTRFLRETHFVSCRTIDIRQSRLAAFRQWLLGQASPG
ncbi:LysR substrate-binding domain-containing protein [Paraburkholderia sp. CNPSo 3076]|uniref:LysR substrate-binding domain-containing protein n=1 Tax=Paraburkholderia sp. CNPSo 3076 TaxID=2940936 RepID=UPI0022596996|nr:LysR substrate-binding domain-containing protein [Paraburkholderia sp. CNPSo 3076]MCX5543405.1 LysR substrate-binding domain-containing protein [Paraburkholderia sp. CNPSo 3076]